MILKCWDVEDLAVVVIQSSRFTANIDYE